MEEGEGEGGRSRVETHLPGYEDRQRQGWAGEKYHLQKKELHWCPDWEEELSRLLGSRVSCALTKEGKKPCEVLTSRKRHSY